MWKSPGNKLTTLQIVKKTKSSKELAGLSGESSLQRADSSSGALIKRSSSRGDLQATSKSSHSRQSSVVPQHEAPARPQNGEDEELLVEYFAVCGIGAESLRDSHDGGRCKPVLLDRLPEQDRWGGGIPAELPQVRAMGSRRNRDCAPLHCTGE